MPNLKDILEQIEEFPTLPTIYTTLLDVMANPRSTVSDVAGIISQDIAASAKILKTVNSSIYQLEHEVDTISQAIFFIGFNEVKNLVITMSIHDMFSKSQSVSKFNLIDLWKHSLAVGVITRFLGQLIGIKNIENYFISGVIHDIGKLFFLKTMNKAYSKVVNFVHENEVTIQEAEKEIIGITHMEVGGLLAERWKLPTTIKNSIKYHSTGVVNGRLDLQVSSVHLANIIARIMELGYPGDYLVHQPNLDIWKILNIDTKSFPQILPRIISDYEQSVSILLISE